MSRQNPTRSNPPENAINDFQKMTLTRRSQTTMFPAHTEEHSVSRQGVERDELKKNNFDPRGWVCIGEWRGSGIPADHEAFARRHGGLCGTLRIHLVAQASRAIPDRQIAMHRASNRSR
jgi:hypothetical protein